MFATATAHCNGRQQDDVDVTERKPLTHLVINIYFHQLSLSVVIIILS